MQGPDPNPPACCHGPSACVFAKALLARSAQCGLAQRRPVGEADVLVCASPVARINCDTLLALLRERASFALRLPRPPAPLVHARALQLQQGGLAALQRCLEAGAPQADVHALVALAQERHGSLLELPWQALVEAVVAWPARRRRADTQP
ncbi:MAG: hypothetical protein KIT35_19085 [Piscinibacter sp.]|uniref:hypothetical protein n=1 Tax=Piscinibacter sp. TaxID=1903157 RepID=UPI00258383C4|nr:hypothetical protein [Piscinibacter sp.]MCW5665940.1 hypothetical protein [Piscinibacter sp.]